ncbi:DUF6556 family protein [Streptococcus parauberis]|uniref:DUF6556 family protein n=1 Tax=Streptococcus parauberis TaxID=1348 RepID=UPI0037956E0A
MSSNYSRKAKTPNKKSVPTKHIVTGLSALQKTIALVGGILSIIVATITIMRTLHPEDTNNKDNSADHSSSTIVKIIEKESSKQSDNSQESTDQSSSLPSSSIETDTSTTTTTNNPDSNQSSSSSQETVPSDTTTSTNTQ